MTDFSTHIQNAPDLTVDEQKKIGTPLKGAIGNEHERFLETLIKLIEEGIIIPTDPQSFLNHEVYDKLDEEWKDKTDLALVNIASQVQHIHSYYVADSTPNDSPQLQNMVEQLWQMKQRIEEHYDCFLF